MTALSRRSARGAARRNAAVIRGLPVISRADHSNTARHRRFERVLLIGLDGATFDVLDPLMDRGLMPNLEALIDGGVSAVLESTKPPITPAAWTTFMTGKGPGKHGIIDFVRYDPAHNKLSLNSNHQINQNAKTIWQILSDKDYRVGSINVPMTYPPEPLKNGFMISGFDTPHGKGFTHPKDLQAEILERYPDYTHEKKWQRHVGGGLDLFAKNIDYINQSFERGYDLAEFCGGKYGWDVMMVLYKLIDNLQHKAWRHLDARTRHRDAERRRLTEGAFSKLDAAVGRLVELGRRHDATIIVMSDHGHGSLDGKAQPNLLLNRWGYLGLRSPLARARTRGAVWWNRLARNGRNGHSPASGLEHDLAIDWSQTRACVLHAGIYGFLYINLKGRQPGGIVARHDRERLRDEIRRRLRDARCPDRDGNEMRIFPEVYVTEDLYGCRRQDHPWLPDLLLSPAPGLAVVKKIRGASPIRWVPFSRLEGTHRLEGILVANGPAIKPGGRIRAHIADIAPTIIAGLGEPVPKDMDGHVLRELFDRHIHVEFEPPQERKLDDADAPVLTEAQLKDVTDRLSDLGYLE